MNVFEKDLYRYYEKEPLRHRLFRPLEVKYIYVMRKCQQTHSLLKLYYRLRLKSLSRKTQIQIPYTTEIGEGFCIVHTGSIVVNGAAKLGKNINIAPGVTIGQENRGKRKGVPTIGNSVWLGTNSVVVGNVTIGDDVLIAPLAYVNFDVPSHSVVVGNPGRIIPRENATDMYIERPV